MTRRAKNESMDERIRQEARRVAARLHPDEFGQPVSIYYLLDKGIIQDLIPGYENETIRGKNLLKTKFYREYVKQAKILLAAWEKVMEGSRNNPRKRYVDEYLHEHIRFPGFPQLIVTRGFAYTHLRSLGWDHKATERMVFAHARAVSDPLTPFEERDHRLGQIEGEMRQVASSENPQDIRTLTQGIFDKSRSSGPTGSRRDVAQAEVRNEHGVLFTYTVYTNRTRTRWWLQLLVGEKPDPSWDWTERAKHAGRQSLHYSFGTSSPQKAQDWIDQVNRLTSGRVNPKDSPLASLLLLPGPGLLEEEIALAGALVNPSPFSYGIQNVVTKEWVVRGLTTREAAELWAVENGKSSFPWVVVVEDRRRRGVGNPASWTLDPRHVLRHGTVMRRPLPAPSSRPASRLPRGVTPPVPKGRTTLYKGVRIIPTEEGWRTSLEYESIFDTIRDAKRFVDAQKRNPHFRERDYAHKFRLPAETDADQVAAENVEWALRERGYATVFKYAEDRGGKGRYDFYTDAGKTLVQKYVDAQKRNPRRKTT